MRALSAACLTALSLSFSATSATHATTCRPEHISTSLQPIESVRSATSASTQAAGLMLTLRSLSEQIDARARTAAMRSCGACRKEWSPGRLAILARLRFCGSDPLRNAPGCVGSLATLPVSCETRAAMVPLFWGGESVCYRSKFEVDRFRSGRGRIEAGKMDRGRAKGGPPGTKIGHLWPTIAKI